MPSEGEAETMQAQHIEAPAPVVVQQTAQAELPFSAQEPAPAPVLVAPVASEPALVEAAEPEQMEASAPAPARVVEAAPAPAPVVEAPKPAPKMEPINLEAAGLVMIETSSDKVAAMPVAEEPAPTPRGPRPKPAWAQAQTAGHNEPLQQVETRGDA